VHGGPGRTRTSNQAVMSALSWPENPANIGISAHVRYRLFAFGCCVLLVIYWSYQINRRKFTRGSSEADEIDRARQWAGEITERSLRHFPPSIGAPRGQKIKKKISPEPRQAIPLPTQVLQPRTRQYCERPLRCSWPLILTFRDRYIGYRTDPVPVCGKRRIECRLRCLGKRR
jgi:hypothetical protein